MESDDGGELNDVIIFYFIGKFSFWRTSELKKLGGRRA